MWTPPSRRRAAAAEASPLEAALSEEEDLEPDSRPIDSSTLEQWLPPGLRHPRWLGWRVRALLGAALLGCLMVVLLARALAAEPWLPGTWRAGTDGRLVLAASADEQLRPFIGQWLQSIGGADGRLTDVDAQLLTRSARWLTRDGDRAEATAQQHALAAALEGPRMQLVFGDGSELWFEPEARGFGGLGPLFWLIAALALVLYVVAMAVLLATPGVRNALFALIALSQCGNLLFIAIETSRGLGLPAEWIGGEAWLRTAFDLVAAAGFVHVSTLHPTRVPRATAIATVCWVLVLALALAMQRGALSGIWWWTQGACFGLGVVAIAVLGWSHHLQPHPFSLVLRRFGVVAVGTWALLTVAIATAADSPGIQQQIARIGSMAWVVFLASLLLLLPFLARSQQVLREFSLLAGISTIAFSLDLLFVSLFSFGAFSSIALTLFLSIGLYVALRQRLMSQLRGTGVLTMERLFERLYRMARDVERQPQQAGAQLLALLRELFEPLEALVAPRSSRSARISSDGSTLLVPVPDLSVASGRADQTLVLRFSRGGRRLFTEDDARLAERIVEQLRRAVAYDQAVERGRSEERSRLAQDLHDDIGARLLTLMYQASTPEQEDYIRHTLQDLKTLTRGLAVGNHRLSYALGEWKADVQHRLKAANIALDWQTRIDAEIELGVVQWSALTRVLRELVSNALAHAQATEIRVTVSYDRSVLELSVLDNGRGRAPQAWSAGLGVGGVRKRVKQLGGEVAWHEVESGGIECRVRLPRAVLQQRR
ncbi:sensor histidine kinase [Rivibacter subsaxonicus]|uniref:histidine kinase n=1 Tax=Rivibacter subsaxonicus TaxID=457575 RepID=A0A4Q7VNQ0_9BURK|nr:ATP-binding protein [Rivibacter subsaxonicus]RZT98016.1 histidine kinase [Rivibacter subsaxonicus]